MADDYGGDLSSFFEDPAEAPSMETLLATSTAVNAEPPQQDPAATHVQQEPVAIPDVQVPVVDPANSMIPVQQTQPPAAQLEQYQKMPDEVQLAAGQSWFEQYRQMVDEVPPPTQFQQYQQMVGEVPPATTPVHHQQILAELPPAPMPFQDQQMPDEVPAAAMPSQDQQMLAELPPAAPFQDQQMLVEWPAGAMSSQDQQMLAELPPALMPSQNQQVLADLPPAAMLGDSAPAATPLEHQRTLGDSSWTLAYQSNYLDLGEELDIDALISLGEGLASDDSGSAMEDDSNSGGDSNLSASDLPDYVFPVDEPVVFVPISPEQLYCGTCNVFREVRHVNAGLGQFLSVHRDLYAGTFQHAIVCRGFPGADWRNPRHELLRLDLTRRTHAWVLRFIARGVETLRNQPGTVEDTVGADDAPGQGGSSSSASAAPAACNDDDAEINMLCELFASIPAVNREAAAPAPAPATATALEDLSAPIGLRNEERAPEVVDASRATQGAQPTPATGDAATLYPSVINMRQLEGRSPPGFDTVEEEEIRRELRAAKERAEMPFPSQLQRLCRNADKGSSHKTMAHLIKNYNRKIVRNVRDSQMRFGKELLKVSMDVQKFADGVQKMYAELVKELKRQRGGGGDGGRCAPPGRNDDGCGPSGGGGGGGSGAGPSGGGGAGAAGSCAALL